MYEKLRIIKVFIHKMLKMIERRILMTIYLRDRNSISSTMRKNFKFILENIVRQSVKWDKSLEGRNKLSDLRIVVRKTRDLK